MKDPTEFDGEIEQARRKLIEEIDDEVFDTLFRPERKHSALRNAFEIIRWKKQAAKRNEHSPYQIFWGILIACIAIPIAGVAALSMVASEGLLKTHIFWFLACYIAIPIFGGASNNNLTAKDLFWWSTVCFSATTAAGWLGAASLKYIILPLIG